MVELDEKKEDKKREKRWNLRYQLSQFLSTIKYFHEAHKLIFRNKSLWFYLALPGIFSVVILLAGFLFGYTLFGEISRIIYEDILVQVGRWFMANLLGSMAPWAVSVMGNWTFELVQTIIYLVLWTIYHCAFTKLSIFIIFNPALSN